MSALFLFAGAVPLALSQPSGALAATLTGGTGRISFFDGTVPIGDAAVSGTQAVLATSQPGTGQHALRATYLGDGAHFAVSASTSTP